MNQPQYPMRPMAQQIQAQGRYGDDILVHMNPAEVQGLASLSPTGKLSINPQTGQPEAFLPMLAAMMGSWLGTGALGGTLASAGLGATLGNAVAGGIGSAIATTAVTGDLKRGLASGILGAGTGMALGGAGGGADAAITDAGSATITDTAMQTALDPALSSATVAPVDGILATAPEAAIPDMLTVAPEAMTSATTPLIPAEQMAMQPELGTEAFTADMASQPVDMSLAAPQQPTEIAPFQDGYGSQTGDRLMAPFQEGSGLGGNLMKPSSMFPIAIGAGQMAQIDQDEEIEDIEKKAAKKKREELQRAYANLQRAYGAAQPGISRGISSARSGMSYNTPLPTGYAAGGIVSFAEGGETEPPTPEEYAAIYDETGEVPHHIIMGIRAKVNAGERLTPEQWLIWYTNQQELGNLDQYTTADEVANSEETAVADEETAARLKELQDKANNTPKDLTYEEAEWLYNNGGSVNPAGLREKVKDGLIMNGYSLTGRGKGSATAGNLSGAYGGIDPVEVQKNLRGEHAVSPPRDYRTGFEPEFDYFQDDPNNIVVPDRHHQPFRHARMEQAPYFDPAMIPEEYRDQVDEYMDTIDVPFDQPDFEPAPQPTDPLPPSTGPNTPGYPYGPNPNPNTPDGLPDSPTNLPGGGSNLRSPQGGVGPATNTDSTIIEKGVTGTQPVWFYNSDGEYVKQVPQGNLYTVDVGDGYTDSFDSLDAARKAAANVHGDSYLDFTPEITIDSTVNEADRAVAQEANEAFVEGRKDGTLATTHRGGYTDEYVATGVAPAPTPPTDWYKNFMAGNVNVAPSGAGPQGGIAPISMAAGGEVPLNTATGTVPVAAGGIASVPTDMVAPQKNPQEEAQIVALALQGQIQGADKIIEMFISKYGVQAFIQLRDQVLKAGNPNAQTEGMIQGQGGGMDDAVPASIGGQQEAAVSPGEFIVPADVVSGIGDGSSDAGAAELQGMMDRVRMARGGSTSQPPPTNAAGMMPR